MNIPIPPEVQAESGLFSEEELQNYIKKVFNLLENNMKPGNSYLVSIITKEDTRQLFIEVVKWYMRMNKDNYQSGISFNNEKFEVLRKTDVSLLQDK